MTDTFSPTRNPDLDLEERPLANIKEVEYGDNYSIRLRDGLNAMEGETFTVRWDYIDQTLADYVFDFLRPKLGWEAFYWTPPYQVTAKKYIAVKDTLIRRYRGNDYFLVACEFKRVFDL